jgi:RNA polymerase-binding protein
MSAKRRPSWPDRQTRPTVRDRLAARQDVPYLCRRGHRFDVTFLAGIDPPHDWDCRCGQPATLRSLT